MMLLFYNKSPLNGIFAPKTKYISLYNYINIILNFYCHLKNIISRKSNNFQKYYLSPHPLQVTGKLQSRMVIHTIKKHFLKK